MGSDDRVRGKIPVLESASAVWASGNPDASISDSLIRVCVVVVVLCQIGAAVSLLESE